MAEEYDFSDESFENFDFFLNEERNTAADEYISKLIDSYPRDEDMSPFEKEQIENYNNARKLYDAIPEKEKERIRDTRKLKQQDEFTRNQKEERRHEQDKYSKQPGLTIDLTEEQKEENRKKFIGGKKRKTKKYRKTKRRKTKRKTRKHRKY